MTKQHEPAASAGKNMGRPLAEINWELVEKLCGLGCTGEDIAGTLKIDYDTLNAAIKRKYKMSFSDYYKKHSASGNVSLRRKQYEVAMAGNVPMLIWLGKQRLGQADKQQTELSGKDGTDLEIKIIREFVD